MYSTLNSLNDVYQRKFEYLRLSITDACNFKCQYCLPNGFKPLGGQSYLSPTEILRLVTCFSELGMWKIRLTGGEPTLRRDFIRIVENIAGIKGVTRLVLSTNGFRLARDAKTFYDAGLRGVNISIDSLEREDFHRITGQDKLHEIMEGIDKAQEAGFDSVKINVVLLKEFNAHKLEHFLEFIRNRNISVRFIELMQTLENNIYFKKQHVSAAIIRDHLIKIGFQKKIREQGAGPAEVWEHSKYQGTIGLIAPYSKDFCTTCNRLRVSSRGVLRLCLFGKGGINLREYLQSDGQKEDLKELLVNSLQAKKKSHFLQIGDVGDTPHFASIGG